MRLILSDTFPKMEQNMQVVKRDGRKEDVAFEKVQERITKAAAGLAVNPTKVAQGVLARIVDGISTTELDNITASLAYSWSTIHPDYAELASQISISNHQKNTPSTLLDVAEALAAVKDRKGEPASLLDPKLLTLIRARSSEIEARIHYERDFLLDYFGLKTLERAYLLRDTDRRIVERPQHLWMRVSLGLWGANLDRAFETYDLMSQKFYTHATPTLFNAGTKRPQLSSCFLTAMKDDSIRGIYNTLQDCALISQYGGGIGLHISNVRAKGTLIKGTGGVSNGIVPMLRVFNNTARYVDQGGGKRNGSFAMYLEPWHADVEDFLDMKRNTGSEEERARDLFYALWVPDLFMERVDAGGDWTLFCPNEAPGLSDVVGAEFKALYERYEAEGRGKKVIKAQKLWFQILDSQIETGTPYLLYKDAANLKSNQQNLGVIKSSNLCVAPETLIYTKEGILPIKDLAGRNVDVWNGDEWSATQVLKTGEAQSLIKVTTSMGAVIECTPYHKFIIAESYYDRKNIAEGTRIDAKDLKPGMKLHKWKNSVIPGDSDKDFKFPYTHGFFCGDGTYNRARTEGKIDRPICSLYGEKKELLQYLEIKSTSGVPDATGRLNVVLPVELEQKFKVPINASLDCRLRWLEGLCDADGSVARNGTNESLQICSIHPDFLNAIRMMMMSMGVNAKVTKAFEANQTMLPDGHGGRKLYDCRPLWRLLISSSGLHTLVDLGFKPHRLVLTGACPQRCAEQYVQIVSVVDEGRISDTYCFNEPKNHAGMFNGILTGNCVEIIEYSSPSEVAVCNLASMSLPAFVKDGAFDFAHFRSVVKVVVRNLNRVIDINYYPIPEAERSNKRHRPIGLGIQGLADVFAILGLAWESAEAAMLNKRIFAHMYYAAMESSCDLAAEEGPYETYVGSPVSLGTFQPDLWNVAPLQDEGSDSLDWDALYNAVRRIGVRNSLLIAPMPTASTSQILGNCECFEPYATHIFTRRTLAGEFIVINKHLVKALLNRGLWSVEMKDAIIGNNGSVTGLVQVPEDIQNVFKTVWEIKQKTLIDMAADRGPYVCQSQSLNLFLADPDYRKLTSMHFYAWRKGLKSGIYYLRTKAVASAQKFTIAVEAPKQAVAEPQEEKECTMCSA